MRDINIAITAASYSGNKGAAAMLQSSVKALQKIYGEKLHIKLMSVYPKEDKEQIPFDFIEVVGCIPQKLLFIAFPLAIIYRLLGWLPFLKKIIGMNKIIKAYRKTDLVIDEAGISFVDSRGAVMNIYAFVCAAVPLLVGTPVVKYSQALGGFKKGLNRTLAKIILPKLKLICARGEITRKNLESIGITKNVRLCADGAFSMPDDVQQTERVNKLCESDDFYKTNKVIAISISSVVEGKCEKMGINYAKIMVHFINYLTEVGYHVLIIANAARTGSVKPRNNDLIICEKIYKASRLRDKIRWYNEEMTAEQIRDFISHCEALVASRFHAMIASLEKSVPVLLVGWSHKYKEVLDMFDLGTYAIDFAKLSLDSLKGKFNEFMRENQAIRDKINKHIDKVKLSSSNNIKYISEIIDEIVTAPNKKSLLDINNPDKYIGEHIECRMGYAKSDDIRSVSSSGGMVTAILCHLLESGKINGAWVTKSVIKDGKPSYKTFIATTKEEITDCGSSIYMHMPLLQHIDEIAAFNGEIAVVMVPCQIKELSLLMEKRKELKKIIKYKLGLYCSGSHYEGATTLPLEKARINIADANRIIYKRGHWRGKTKIFFNNGKVKSISYTKNICAYKNAYFFERESCFICQDHYASFADISFGDIWLKEMKKNPIKHTSCVIRTPVGMEIYNSAVKSGVISDFHIGDEKIVLSQKRSLVFKFNCAKQKERLFAKENKTIKIYTGDKCKVNHKLAANIAYKNMNFSLNKYESLKKIPKAFIYWYMLFIRALLSK